MKEIRLAGGKKAYVDDDIFSIVGGLGWQTSTHGKNWYAYRQLWFRNAPKKDAGSAYQEALRCLPR
ncbi:MAG: hypothetical protein UMS36scaffold28_42 [Phage 59_13]|nr:MAG: hypothetical protein UMS36scaffold28_42 [Phage 59_13]